MTAGRLPLPDPVPFGYYLKPTRRGPVLAGDPVRLEWVRAAFALADATPCTLRQIARILWADGLRTWCGLPFPAKRLRALLREPFYAGFVFRQGRLVPGRRRALVARDLFDRVQAALGPEEAPHLRFR